MEAMLRDLRTGSVTLTLLLVMACGSRPEPAILDGPPSDLRASASAFYDAYGSAISTPHREAIASFYHPDGALRVLNGHSSRQTRAAIDSSYRGAWSPPAFFAWEELAFDSIAPGQVLVTGGFLWQGAGQADTAKFVYAALLEAVDSGMAIRFEHETARPAP